MALITPSASGSAFTQSRSASLVPATSSAAKTKATNTGNATNMSQDDIRAMFELFDIDIKLSRAIFSVGSGINLFDKYARWVAVNKASSVYDNHKNADTWPFPVLSTNALIDHFIAKSTYHKINTLFTSITNNPEFLQMVEWLQCKGTTSEATEVWGIEQNIYKEEDLQIWIKNNGSLVKRKKSHKKVSNK